MSVFLMADFTETATHDIAAVLGTAGAHSLELWESGTSAASPAMALT